MGGSSHGKHKPQVGDEVVTEVAIDLGDLVVFDQRAPHRFIIRRLVGSELDNYVGDVFRVEVGEEPRSRRLKPFRRGKAQSEYSP